MDASDRADRGFGLPGAHAPDSAQFGARLARLGASEPSHTGLPLASRDLAALLRDYEFVQDGGLGEGAFGAVRRVHHRASQEARACKTLRVQDAAALSQVRLEASLLAALDHPSILRLYETFYDDGAAFLVTELCAGGALSDRVRHHEQTCPMPEHLALRYLEQILGALRYCHGRSVLHRDLKPENVLFLSWDAQSPLKLIDFGLATTTELLQTTARTELLPRSLAGRQLARLGLVSEHREVEALQRAGTPHYMAPEVYLGRYGAPADVWSCGVVFVQLLAEHPFYSPSESLAAVRRRVLETSEQELRERLERRVQPQVRDLALLLLRRDPEERISAREALGLRCFLELPRTAEDQLTAADALEGLRQFAASPPLRRGCLVLLARDLPEQQLRPLRSLFARLEGGDGLRDLELPAAEREEWRRLLLRVAPSGLPQVLFLAAMLRHARLREEQLRACFARLPDGLTREALAQVQPDALRDLGSLDFQGFCQLVAGSRVVS